MKDEGPMAFKPSYCTQWFTACVHFCRLAQTIVIFGVVAQSIIGRIIGKF
jgi:hypothetical protein